MLLDVLVSTFLLTWRTYDNSLASILGAENEGTHTPTTTPWSVDKLSLFVCTVFHGETRGHAQSFWINRTPLVTGWSFELNMIPGSAFSKAVSKFDFLQTRSRTCTRWIKNLLFAKRRSISKLSTEILWEGQTLVIRNQFSNRICLKVPQRLEEGYIWGRALVSEQRPTVFTE